LEDLITGSLYESNENSLCWCFFTGCGGCALFGREILSLFTTQAYANAAPLIGMLGFSFGLTIVAQTIGLGAGITKRTEFNTLIYFASVGGQHSVFIPAGTDDGFDSCSFMPAYKHNSIGCCYVVEFGKVVLRWSYYGYYES